MRSKTFSVKLKFLVHLLIFSVAAHFVTAQSRPGKNWIFGSGEVLVFGDDTDRTLQQGEDILQLNIRAVANNPNTGDVLFYTDGNTVYDACGNILVTGLGGTAAANQPVVISPKPGGIPGSRILEYYIIVNTGGNIIYREISVDLEDGPTPCHFQYTIDGTNQATGVTGAGEAMVVVPNDDNSGFWLVTQTPGSTAYAITEITAAGLINTQNFTLGGGAVAINAVNFSYNPETNQIAVAGANPGGDVQILQINPANGGLTYELSIGGIGAGQSAFDTEWSADGTKLYISTGPGGQLLQYNFTVGALNVVPGTGAVTNSFGLQRGPDGDIYHLYQATNGGPHLLGKINAADSAFSLLTYSPSQFGGNNFGTPYFPELSPLTQYNYSASFTAIGNCQNQPTQFVPSFPPGTPQPDSITWIIDGQAFRGFSPSYSYQDPGGGQATIVAHWPNTTATFSAPVTIQQFDIQIQIPPDTTICPGTTAMLNAEPQSGQGGGGGSYQYLWSTGETTAEVEVDEAGVYWVVVRDQSTGCAAYAESNVKEI